MPMKMLKHRNKGGITSLHLFKFIEIVYLRGFYTVSLMSSYHYLLNKNKKKGHKCEAEKKKN